MSHQVLRTLLSNFKQFLDGCGIDTTLIDSNDIETISMFFRLRVLPYVNNPNALEQMIPPNLLANMTQDQKDKGHRFLSAICEIVA